MNLWWLILVELFFDSFRNDGFSWCLDPEFAKKYVLNSLDEKNCYRSKCLLRGHKIELSRKKQIFKALKEKKSKSMRITTVFWMMLKRCQIALKSPIATWILAVSKEKVVYYLIEKALQLYLLSMNFWKESISPGTF